jgi:enoyl-CoA hydratase
MGIEVSIGTDGIAEVVQNCPPVNALTVAEWFQLGDEIRRLGADRSVRAVILRSEGRGFNAGVDIKEMQNTEGFGALIGANKGCYHAFAAVYECEVPVIAAVAGFCVGGGIGLVGNADVIVASDDAFFGLPEVDRGALGAATHLSRLVPQHKMREMVYTSANATAQQLHAWGSVARVVPRDELLAVAREIAGNIAAKSPTVIRAAKESLNGIDLWDVKKSYRFEQGFTFELNLSGVADELRDDFVAEGKSAGSSGATKSEKGKK